MEPYKLNQISWLPMWPTGWDKDEENPLMGLINLINSALAHYLLEVDNKNNS